MPYYNITSTTTKPIHEAIQKDWVHSLETTFLKKHAGARAGYFLLFPVSFITSALDTIIGLGVTVGAIATLGRHRDTFEIAHNHLQSSRFLAALPFANLLRTINPEARFSMDKSFVNLKGDGFITEFAKNLLQNFANDCQYSKNVFKQHICSRLTYALLALSSLVTRVVDAIIGLTAAFLCILTAGKCQSLNHLAFRSLQAPGVIKDLAFYTVKCINPWAEEKKLSLEATENNNNKTKFVIEPLLQRRENYVCN